MNRLARETMFRWVVRTVFWCGLIYIYFAVYCRPTFGPYRFLLANLFLSYVPIELSFHLEEKTSSHVFWPVFVVWFFFYPNAPYMLTDFFHLALRNPYILRPDGTQTSLLSSDAQIWFMFLNLSSCALASTFIGIMTMHRTISVLLLRLRRKTVWRQATLVLVVTVTVSVGIYIGRFPRLHTIHLVTQPIKAIKCLVVVCDMRCMLFTVIMTAVQMFAWGLLMLIRLSPQSAPMGCIGSTRT